MEKTRLSNKGQVVIPKAVRALHGWKPGLEFVVEAVADGVMLKPIKPFQETKIKDVVGCVGYEGPRKSLHDMEAAIAKGAKEGA
jgi:AbrB family looped-hinge helix DNA binding protein